MPPITHRLVEGREVCERHHGGMTFVGKNCICGFWACACGQSLGLRKDHGAIEDVDVTFEQHVIHEGAQEQLPSVSKLITERDWLRAEQAKKNSEFAAAELRLAGMIARASARETVNNFSARRFTLEGIAANAAIMAGIAGQDADMAHRQAYTKHHDLAARHGLLEQAEEGGLTAQSWISLKELEK